MDPYIKITKKFTKKFGTKAINRQYFHKNTGLYKNQLKVDVTKRVMFYKEKCRCKKRC